MHKKFIIAIALFSVLLAFSGCGKKQYGFNIGIKELRTDIEPGQYEIETLIAPAWGNADGQVGLADPPGPYDSEVFESGPEYFYADAGGRVFIVDEYNIRTIQYSPVGDFVMNYPTELPRHITSDNEGILYFSCSSGNMLCYDLSGKLLRSWSYKEKPADWGEQEWYPGNIPIIGNDDYLYMIGNEEVSDEKRVSVTRWDKQGYPLASFLLGKEAVGEVAFVDEYGRFFTKGYDNKIEVFDANGKHVRAIPINTSDNLSRILGIDSNNNLYILLMNSTDSRDWYVFKYSSNGDPVARLDLNSYDLDLEPLWQLNGAGQLFMMSVPDYYRASERTLKIYKVDL